MSYASIRIERLTPHIGAEIHGVDLARPLDEHTFKEVHDALIENGVIFFRDQHLTRRSSRRPSAGSSASCTCTRPRPALLEGHPEILVIHADEKSKRVAGEEWHSDVSCDPEPPMGSILYMHELPPVGGDTLFASMYAAYDTLSEPMKRFLEALTAMHEGEHVYRGRYGVRTTSGKVSARPSTRSSARTPSPGARRCSSTAASPRASSQLKRTESDARARAALPPRARRPSCTAASAGSRARSPSGTIAASSTTRCGTTSRSAATGIA